MSHCALCQHEKIEIINAALTSGVAPGIIARRYRLEPLLMKAHHEHRMQERQALTPDHVPTNIRSSIDMVLIACRENTPREMTENPMSLLKQAWQLAKDDDRLRASMVSWINEQLQTEDMGLP